jgi:glycosyltransferase involved in cell wall biosynthesis
MKIVYLAAGAAGMYCGSCLHDNTLAAALLKAGHDVLLVPTYTPIRTDETDVSQRRVFFGGINVFLQQKSALFRHTPWLLDSLLDSPSLISLATRGGPSVDAAKLGDLTVSMLEGEHGHQAKELRKLTAWLASERPDVVHLSNSMLLGMAREIRRQSLPVVCTLSGEDIFLEKLIEPFYSEARQLLRECAADVDGFVALNHYYADFMAEYLAIDRSRIEVIPHGLSLDGHTMRPPRDVTAPPKIGYLARVCHDKGLHLLVEAIELLHKTPGYEQVELHAAGYMAAADKPYLAEIEARVKRWSAPRRFRYHGELTREQKLEFLRSLDIMSVPTVYRESKGISLLEALANGVPIVVPAHGTFPELVAQTGAGVLHEPHDARSLADALRSLIANPARAAELGETGYQAVHRLHNADQMAAATGHFYETMLNRRTAS